MVPRIAGARAADRDAVEPTWGLAGWALDDARGNIFAMVPRDPRVDAVVARYPELKQLALEVDRSLLRWSLGLSPLQRLRAASNSLRGLRRFRRVTPRGG
jgi:hypothetical protein